MDDKFDCLMIDPPWPKTKGGLRSIRPNQGKTLDYKTMSVEEIFALLDRDVFPKAQDNHNVFLWTIDEFLISAEVEMLCRGTGGMRG